MGSSGEGGEETDGQAGRWRSPGSREVAATGKLSGRAQRPPLPPSLPDEAAVEVPRWKGFETVEEDGQEREWKWAGRREGGNFPTR
jgi:hypothetical protein